MNEYTVALKSGILITVKAHEPCFNDNTIWFCDENDNTCAVFNIDNLAYVIKKDDEK
jgi:hypothetical protein